MDRCDWGKSSVELVMDVTNTQDKVTVYMVKNSNSKMKLLL